MGRIAEKKGHKDPDVAKVAATALAIEPLTMSEVGLCLLGASPLIYNRMAEKAKRELLLPASAKNRATRRETLKHNPIEEYRASVYSDPRPDSLTRLVFPAPAFKAAMMTAALEIPGATKASIGRLLQVAGFQVRIFGVPQIFLTGVRQAGINRTPDIRTRACLPRWATQITVRYPAKTLGPASIANLIAAAGQLCGVGDFRQEKGKGSFGLFSLVNFDDPEYQEVLRTGAAEAQDKALAQPEPFDTESGELWQWFEEEIIARGRGGEVGHAAA